MSFNKYFNRFLQITDMSTDAAGSYMSIGLAVITMFGLIGFLVWGVRFIIKNFNHLYIDYEAEYTVLTKKLNPTYKYRALYFLLKV